jgi:hypothetical protein
MMAADPSSLAASFRSETTGRTPLSGVRRAYYSGYALELLRGLILEERNGGRHLPRAIVATMAFLEGLEPFEPVLSAHLMALLYPMASSHFVHEVADAIELWMEACQNAEVARLLHDLHRTSTEQTTFETYGQWADNIDSKTRNKP